MPADHPANHPADVFASPAVSRRRQPRWLLVTMILLSVGYVGVFVFALMMAVTSPLMFDSGSAARNWLAFFAAIVFPLFVVGNVALAWCGYSFRHRRLILVGFLLPILYMVAFWIFFS